MPKNTKNVLVSLAAAVALTGLAACGGSDSSGDDAAQTQTSDAAAETSAGPGAAGAAAAPEPDLAGVPEVVADVNGEEIPREDFVNAYEGQFQQMAAQSQATGQEVDQDQLKQQTVDNMVGNVLLIQAADKAKIDPSTKEVDATLEELAAGNGVATVEEFLTVLEEQGFTEEEARAAVSDQLKVDQFITQEAAIKEPTEQELRELYDSLAQQQAGGGAESGAESGGGSGLPAFEEVKPQLTQQLTQQQESEAINAILEKLRADADITVNL